MPVDNQRCRKIDESAVTGIDGRFPGFHGLLSAQFVAFLATLSSFGRLPDDVHAKVCKAGGLRDGNAVGISNDRRNSGHIGKTALESLKGFNV